jgi:uncharacterized membrane protein
MLDTSFSKNRISKFITFVMKEVINLVGYFEYMSRVTRETDAHIWFIFVVYLRRLYIWMANSQDNVKNSLKPHRKRNRLI